MYIYIQNVYIYIYTKCIYIYLIIYIIYSIKIYYVYIYIYYIIYIIFYIIYISYIYIYILLYIASTNFHWNTQNKLNADRVTIVPPTAETPSCSFFTHSCTRTAGIVGMGLERTQVIPSPPVMDKPPVIYNVTWWLIPLSKWVITGVINGISRVNPLITGVITHLLSGMSHQVMKGNSNNITIMNVINHRWMDIHVIR